jgi:exopolysaccharide biosynthesis polyprenyl glycosylphosphotransferase
MSQKLASQTRHFYRLDHRVQEPLASNGHHPAALAQAVGYPMGGYPFYRDYLDLVRPPSFYPLAKRLFDLALVLLSLPLTLPLLLLLALLVRLDSDGSAFFIQRRTGRNGAPFAMVKFRSMRVDSEERGAQFTASGDDRTTRLGRVLRRYRLDELPQLWNVFKGEMSLIGPRPEQVPFVERFIEEIPLYDYRHQVRPGITGWAQVNQGYAAGVEETRLKLAYDLYYIKHFSLWMDLWIVLRTARTVLTGFGAK